MLNILLLALFKSKLENAYFLHQRWMAFGVSETIFTVELDSDGVNMSKV